MPQQFQFTLPAFPRGFHLVTDLITRNIDITHVEAGLFHLFIQHTSASITINENADPTVREDFEQFFLRAVPESSHYFKHNYEGPDDMPAHIKASMLGNSVTIPITNGKLNLGIWQGIYLGEHRVHGGERSLVATVMG